MAVLDKRTGAGILIGFFLATAILFGFVQLSMAKDYQSLKQTRNYAQLSYEITHSIAYSDVQSFVMKIDEGANEIASLPIIGSVVSKSKAPEYTQMVVDMLQGRKELAEQELNLINAEIALIEFSVPALLFSIVMMGAGAYMLMADEKKAKKGKKG